ncbi:MAG: bifunctional diaminohydroxyphosphoribosylaminopyrimidine deaminase/5-amino-6-(5-phosphoribosylamino)uracil reductase RibD [Mediterranea sp.]|jgi:diaminohydroxyphosphoribosylaminopyrimidine deaminase/5-amino-6-(5-phosphoribosylamino)uracil reductase|nr:bifunctional diaminohydroxyphosphoribosylaminopyrimidine deaminase/5-amino-6-(5-phosphoribosylamino)uracil reductase RibD [Mediterranea sp.]
MISEEEKYMRRCLELAANGFAGATPNPMVGAVVVCDGRIIGEGYHVRYGGPHAEVNAIRSVRDEASLGRSTIYVSLEPCSHYGKTPPCADLLIAKGIPRVVVGCQDPFPEVAGRGIGKLRAAGREVVVGVLEKECRHLNRRFITFHTKRRPYITLKWAQSADGFIDRQRVGGQPVIFSTPLTTMLAHKRRAETDAIMVGTHTALLDNPSLTVRHWYGRDPLRVVVDRNLLLPPDRHLFDHTVPTLVFTARERCPEENLTYVTIDFGGDSLSAMMDVLYQRGVQSLLVEGGSLLLRSFIDAGLWDEAYVEQSPVRLLSGVEAPVIDGASDSRTESRFGHHFLILTR